mgnify:CR=1 FL=1
MASAVKIVIEAKDKTKKGLMAPIKSLKDLNKAVDDLKPAFKALALAGTAAFAAIAKSSVDAVMDMIRVKNGDRERRRSCKRDVHGSGDE